MISIILGLSYIEIMAVGLVIIVTVALTFCVVRYSGRYVKDNRKIQGKMTELEKELETLKKQTNEK